MSMGKERFLDGQPLKEPSLEGASLKESPLEESLMEERFRKDQLREEMKRRKRALTEEEIFRCSREITQTLLEQPEYKKSSSIFVYANFNQEVVTIGLIKQILKDGKRAVLPRVDGSAEESWMNFYQIQSLDDLEAGAYSIPEPRKELTVPVLPDEDSWMILPGLAFDKSGSRLGYGKGYYDRYLERHPMSMKTGICYDFQLLPAGEIPTGSNDQKVTKIITPIRMVYE